jgi:hypothetical protein
MKRAATAIALATFGILTIGSASAQVAYYDPVFGPICATPFGLQPCAAAVPPMLPQVPGAPQHLQPNVIVGNAQRDLQSIDPSRPFSDTNDLVGRHGWFRQRLGF